jgi:aryl-alcohol dehydrogenase-like predicted oxidoreductase
LFYLSIIIAYLLNYFYVFLSLYSYYLLFSDKLLVEKHHSKLDLYESFCEKLGVKSSNVALAWLLHNPVVTAPIIGPRTIEQLVDSLLSLDIDLSEESLNKLDSIWPGPGGEAPEAYAW